MQIDLTKVLSQEGRTQSADAEYSKKQFESKRGIFPVVGENMIHFELEHFGNRVLSVVGSGKVDLMIPCARCLEPVLVSIDISAKEKIDLKLSLDERSGEEDSGSYIDGQKLDVDEFVHNQILINWPLRVLCKDDCKGICSHCGCNRNLTECDCDTTELDPRMAAIKDIFNQFKEV
ncbi:MAG: DUF177 domain-containing protein [Lachnospiraceae bacterium]|nr:DUF177 domain-containing protein [Lachnospiraceae bacterium]MDD3617050.1 DUF177 domain-containing protein [Lachnospiraceae bacterium]